MNIEHGFCIEATLNTFLGFVLQPLVVTLVIIFVLYSRLLIWRLREDAKYPMDGFSPSWWSPFGAELLFFSLWDRKREVVGEALLRLLSADRILSHGRSMGRLWLFFYPVTFVFGASAVEPLMNSSVNITKAMFYKSLHKWLGTGLLTSNGSKWRERRKMLTPAFHFRILEEFLPIFSEHSRTFVELLKQHSKHEFDIVQAAKLCTLDVICETAMGVQIEAQSNSESEYVKAISQTGTIFTERILSPWLWSDFVFGLFPIGRQFHKSVSVLHNFTRKVIVDRKAQMVSHKNESKNDEENNTEQNNSAMGIKRRRPFLDLLLERHLQTGDLSLADIQEEVDTFMFEGHDTTAMGISWALYLLGENADCQQKAYQELSAIFADDPDRDVTIHDLQEMKYLECCLKESQRLFPSVPLFAREITHNVEIDGRTFSSGMTVIVNAISLHRDESVFPKADIFDPERFLPKNCVNRNPFAYVPFSAGPRNCIGQRFAMMEMKVIVSSVLRNFKIRSVIPRYNIKVIAEFVTRPKDGLPLIFYPRNKEKFSVH